LRFLIPSRNADKVLEVGQHIAIQRVCRLADYVIFDLLDELNSFGLLAVFSFD